MADSDKIDRQDTSRKMDDMVRDAVNGATAGQMILVQEALNANLTDDVKQLVGSVVEYKEMMMRYTCAIKEIKTSIPLFMYFAYMPVDIIVPLTSSQLLPQALSACSDHACSSFWYGVIG